MQFKPENENLYQIELKCLLYLGYVVYKSTKISLNNRCVWLLLEVVTGKVVLLLGQEDTRVSKLITEETLSLKYLQSLFHMENYNKKKYKFYIKSWPPETKLRF